VKPQWFLGVFFFCLCAAGENLMPLDLSEGWIQRTEGPWRIRYDHRDLLAMRHPWEPSRKGAYASVSRKMGAPADWPGEVRLSFYCSDDYNTDGWRPDGSWLTAEGFVGHRMKQVLVDDRVVWSADVSDPVEPGVSPYFDVPLGVTAGREFLLTLVVYDAEGSGTVLPGDFYQSANDKLAREADPDAASFMTNVYWGDVQLSCGEVGPRQERRPVEKKVRAVHAAKWPLPPFGDAEPPAGPVRLEVSAPGGMPKEGFPVRFGVPLHAGRVRETKEVCLRYPNGRSLYSQKTPTGTWPDESIQWVLFDFAATPEMKGIDLVFEPGLAMRPAAATVKESESETSVDAGLVRFDWIQGRLISDVAIRGRTRISELGLSMLVEGEEIEAVTESANIAEAGPFRTTLAVEGKFSLLDRTTGSYRLEATVFAKLPYVRMVVRVYNDTHNDLPVSGLRLRVRLPNLAENVRFSGEVEAGAANTEGNAGETPAPQLNNNAGGTPAPQQTTFVLRQVSETERELNGVAVDAGSPAFVTWQDGTLTVRQFRELYPKLISVTGDTIVADLIAAGEAPVVFTPGEAKTHEVWLALGEVEPEAFAAAVAAPPVPQNAAYYCSTGAFGPAAAHDGVPVLHAHMTQLGKTWEDFGQRFGVRDFPDASYHGGLPQWCNNYYERMLGLWSEWIMSGDRAWFDLAGDVCRHVMDVAVVHSEVPGKDWLGALHGPGANHVAGPWNPTLRNGGLAFYSKLTGDAAAMADALGVAEFCMRTHAGVDSGSVRDHAGPFDAICTAYQETGGIEYLDEGAARVAAVLKRMDMRRGVWAEEHGSKVYRGNVPWMVAQVGRPLYLWYRLTGDVHAAQALVGLAESIICENTTWDEPGSVSGYSHNPHFAATATYDLLIVPVVFAAYELTEDEFFLDAAKAQWERWQKAGQFDSPLNCHWNTPWLVYYLKRYGVVGAGETE